MKKGGFFCICFARAHVNRTCTYSRHCVARDNHALLHFFLFIVCVVCGKWPLRKYIYVNYGKSRLSTAPVIIRPWEKEAHCLSNDCAKIHFPPVYKHCSTCQSDYFLYTWKGFRSDLIPYTQWQRHTTEWHTKKCSCWRGMRLYFCFTSMRNGYTVRARLSCSNLWITLDMSKALNSITKRDTPRAVMHVDMFHLNFKTTLIQFSVYKIKNALSADWNVSLVAKSNSTTTASFTPCSQSQCINIPAQCTKNSAPLFHSSNRREPFIDFHFHQTKSLIK